MEISFHSHLNSNTVIATKLCTWHDCCAVVACAKMCWDLKASNGITARRSFHWIWIAVKKSLVRLHSNTDVSSPRYKQISIVFRFGNFGWHPFFSINNILGGLWLYCISSVEIFLLLLADISLQHMLIFSIRVYLSDWRSVMKIDSVFLSNDLST